MLFVPLALVAGLVVGLLRAGSTAEIRRTRVRSRATLVGAVGLATVVALAPRLPGESWWLGASLVSGIVACVINRHLTGASIVALGCAANLLPLVLNGHIPVDPAAAVAAGIIAPSSDAAIDPGFARSLQGPDTVLAALGAIVPVPGIAAIMTFGDLILTAGLANVGYRIARPRPELRTRPADGPSDTPPTAEHKPPSPPASGPIDPVPGSTESTSRRQPGLSR